MLMARDRAADLGRETLKILDAGHYQTPAGKTVLIGNQMRHAVEGTRDYPPEHVLAPIKPRNKTTRIEVINETTLAAACRLITTGVRPLALNFAAATDPGGGFLSGARAQEEALTRSSGLYACLVDQPMYKFHRARHDPMYTSYAIYSPDVPIFRADDGTLLEEPYLCSFITSPAVNARAVLKRDPSRRPQIAEVMRERIARVLAIAAIEGHDTLVLGAWGCGAFGNDGQTIADLFRGALVTPFRGIFARVVFAITDWSKERRFIGPFQRAFAGSLTAGP